MVLLSLALHAHPTIKKSGSASLRCSTAALCWGGWNGGNRAVLHLHVARSVLGCAPLGMVLLCCPAAQPPGWLVKSPCLWQSSIPGCPAWLLVLKPH